MEIYKTNYPLNSYLLLIILVVEGVFMIGFPISMILFYIAGTFLLFYILFSRYACKVTIYDNRILVQYFFFWEKNVCLLFEEISEVDYAKGFYDLVDDKALGGLYGFPRYCYDQLIFKKKSSEIEILVNTRIGTFGKMFSNLREIVAAGTGEEGVVNGK